VVRQRAGGYPPARLFLRQTPQFGPDIRYHRHLRETPPKLIRAALTARRAHAGRGIPAPKI
jgi:hypothetical protein